MNTIIIDSGIYQFVANYAAKRKVSVSSIVENFILSLRDKDHMDKVDTDNVESKILPWVIGTGTLIHSFTNNR